ncbi:sigma-70 family RNA polymerase sigma factor [uncultured Ruminococcus sp.]|uniref:RNA polymerase sigma factor n=1 Tax=uncultured Ruminococcus sp. TaxID=165186 RepID=UPI002930CE1C|nr:sigma-70 family RNA polymerase sigma factor [uncultured Ruminococcus sp.]
MTKETFTKLILENEEIMFRLAMSMLKNEADAQDAVQSAILSAYEKLTTLKNEDFFRTWLMRILINVCKMQLRHRKPVAELTDIQTAITSSTEEVEVRAAVEALPLKFRQVVILYYTQQLSTKEIASILHIPKGTVLSRLDKARKLLRTELE